LILILAFTPLAAQDVAGGLVGRVYGDGVPLPDVQITISGSSLQGERRVTTDGRGYFKVLDLPVGNYTLRLVHIGFRPLTYEGVRVRLGTTTELGDLGLASQVVELPEIRVAAERPAIDPVSTTLGSVLDVADFEQLPVGRDYQSIITMLPHANESFFGDGLTIGGSTGLENAYFIDGVNVTDHWVARGGTRLPYNFVQSVQVRNGGYEAEYGRALGGVVNAVTYSGGNVFEGNVFGFFSHSALADDARVGLTDLRVDRFHTVDVGLRLGGPIVRDRAWFSMAYNPRFDRSDREIPGHGFFGDRFILHSFAGKAVWSPSPSTNIELSVFGDPSTSHVVAPATSTEAASALLNPQPYLRLKEEGGAIAALRLRQQLSQSLQVEARLSRSSTRSNQVPDTTESVFVPLFIDRTTNTWSGGPGSLDEVTSHRTAASVAATALLGRHATKVGFEYEDNYIQHRYRADQQFRTDSTSFFTYIAHAEGSHHNRTPSIYVQDSWQALRRLVVNAGVRWSTQGLIGPAGTVAQGFSDEWQPRLGIVYQLGFLGTQRVFGSYGRFYQQLPVFFSTLSNVPVHQVVSFYDQDPRTPGVQPTSVENFSLDPSPAIHGLRAEHFDEFTLGYERLAGKGIKLQARGVHRVLRAAFGFAIDLSRDPPLFAIGNLGVGDLGFLPKPRRRYSALELTLARVGDHRLTGQVSYVLSRTYGNYTGLFSSDQGVATPGENLSLELPEQVLNSTGLLPNDRTHVLKLNSSYRFGFGLTVGTFTTIQSGTPLNEFGATTFGPLRPVFLVERGSAGRTPTIWDVNFRLSYSSPPPNPRWVPRITLDLLHIGSPRRMTNLDQVRFLSRDESGNQILPNPNFGRAFAHQSPMAARLGFELDF
jgi:hypothetical protein